MTEILPASTILKMIISSKNSECEQLAEEMLKCAVSKFRESVNARTYRTCVTITYADLTEIKKNLKINSVVTLEDTFEALSQLTRQHGYVTDIRDISVHGGCEIFINLPS